MLREPSTGPVYILVYPDGKYAALDGPSGGYPYGVIEWYHAEFWTDINRMLKYKDMFKDEKFEIYQIIPQFMMSLSI